MNTEDIWNRVERIHQPPFLQGGGRMAEAILAFDWSTTSIGAIGTWPTSLRTIVRMMVQTRQPICLFWGRDLNILYNDAYAPFLGARGEGALGRPFEAVWSDVWSAVAPIVAEALSGNGTWSENLPLTMTRNGYEEATYWSFSYSPLYDDDGSVAGLVNIATETTAAVENKAQLNRNIDDAREQLQAQKELDAQQQVIQREMAHRIKNILSMTMAVVSQTMRHSDDMKSAAETISRRIAALADAQDVLTNARFSEADVGALVTQVLKPHVADMTRLRLGGPAIVIPAQQALGIALAIHELATNAAKYGALSNDDGTVSLDWSHSPQSEFRLEWSEEGGPPVVAPTRTGFGSRLMNRIVPGYFDGAGESSYDPSGYRYVLVGKIAGSGNENGFPPLPLATSS